MRRSNAEVVLVAAAATLFGLASVRTFLWFAGAYGVPFFDWTFYAGAVDRWLAGEQIYPGARISTLGSATGSSYAYPPASVPLMLPFASWPVGAILWEAVIVGALLLGTWSVVRIGWPDRPLIVFALTLIAMSLLEPLMEGVALGNVNIATAGMLGFVWAHARFTAAAAGVLGVVKVFPLALAAPLGWRTFARAAGIAGLVCLVTLPLVGIGAWSDYVTGLEASQPRCGDPQWINQSLACAMSPYVGSVIAKWAGLGIAAGAVALALHVGPGFVGAALATVAVLAPATELHGHYLAIVFVLFVIGLASLNLRRSARLASS